MDEDLKTAATKALEVDKKSCREFAEQYSWDACTQQFLKLLQKNCPNTAAEPAEKTS
jgi:glycosyltransferase involved in cell wall biosynthesis